MAQVESQSWIDQTVHFQWACNGGEGGIRCRSRWAKPVAPNRKTGRLRRRLSEAKELAERVGFEPTCRSPGKTLSRRPRYDHFGTSPRVRLWRYGGRPAAQLNLEL
jgi:hypothetical protein